MGDSGEIAEWLADHDGVVTAVQARTLGLSADQVQGRLRRKEWVPITKGIYRSACHPFGEAALVRGAVLAYRGVADRATAAWWHGLVDELATPLTISVGCRSGVDLVPRCPVKVRRRTFAAEDLTEWRGLRVTGKPLTVLLAAADQKHGARLIDRALQTEAVTLDELNDALDRNAGRTGLKAARKWLAIASDDSESFAERLFVKLLRQEQITGWVQQLPFEFWKLDFAWPEEKLSVEIDGWAFHNQLDRFRSDRRKGNALEAAGWCRLTFTWHDLVEDPIGCMERVAAALAERRAESGC